MRVDDYCRAVIRSTKLTLAEQAVLWMLATYVNRQTGETFVSLATIAADIRANERWVRRVVGKLVTEGVLAIVYRPGRSSLYRFPIHPALSTTPDSQTMGLGDRGSTTPGLGDRGVLSHRPGDPCPTGPTNHVPNQVLNRAPGPVDDEHDPTPGWFKDRIVRHIEAETVDVLDPDRPELEQPRMMWEVSM